MQPLHSRNDPKSLQNMSRTCWFKERHGYGQFGWPCGLFHTYTKRQVPKITWDPHKQLVNLHKKLVIFCLLACYAHKFVLKRTKSVTYRKKHINHFKTNFQLGEIQYKERPGFRLGCWSTASCGASLVLDIIFVLSYLPQIQIQIQIQVLVLKIPTGGPSRLDLGGQDSSLLDIRLDWPSLKNGLKLLVRWIVKALEIAKKAGQFHVFFVLFSNIFLRVFQGHFKGTIH